MAWYKNQNSVAYQPSEIPEAIRNLSDLYHPDTASIALLKKRRESAKEIYRRAHPLLSEDELNMKFYATDLTIQRKNAKKLFRKAHPELTEEQINEVFPM